MTIELGQTVTDSITGFTGIITGIAEYLYGCRQACVVSKTIGKEDKPVSIWFDEQRLAPAGEVKATSGGPQFSPPVTG